MALLLVISVPALAAENKLGFPVDGVVAKVLVRAGAAVKAGMPLAELDLRPFIAEKTAADAQMTAAELSRRLADENVERIKQLYDDLSTSQEEVDEAETRAAHARADYERAKSDADIAAWRLERATLQAPRDGVVKSVPGYPGLVIQPAAGMQSVVILR